MRVRIFWHSTLALTLAAFFVSGCERPVPVAPTDAHVAALDASLAPIEPGEELPFQWSGSGVFLGQDFAPDFGPPTFGKSDFNGRCSIPADYVVRFSMAGQATHLGEVNARLEHCGYIDWQTGLGTDRDGTMLITAADGDELYGSYEGEALGGGHFSGTVEFIGGTGRFVDASGHGTISGATDRSSGTIPVFELEGVIVYAASNAAE
jgi:hypothetical protein